MSETQPPSSTASQSDINAYFNDTNYVDLRNKKKKGKKGAKRIKQASDFLLNYVKIKKMLNKIAKGNGGEDLEAVASLAAHCHPSKLKKKNITIKECRYKTFFKHLKIDIPEKLKKRIAQFEAYKKYDPDNYKRKLKAANPLQKQAKFNNSRDTVRDAQRKSRRELKTALENINIRLSTVLAGDLEDADDDSDDDGSGSDDDGSGSDGYRDRERDRERERERKKKDMVNKLLEASKNLVREYKHEDFDYVDDDDDDWGEGGRRVRKGTRKSKRRRVRKGTRKRKRRRVRKGTRKRKRRRARKPTRKRKRRRARKGTRKR